MNPFEDIFGNPLFGLSDIIGYRTPNEILYQASQAQAAEAAFREWRGGGMANSKEAMEYNERGRLSIKKDNEIKNKIYVYDDIQ